MLKSEQTDVCKYHELPILRHLQQDILTAVIRDSGWYIIIEDHLTLFDLHTCEISGSQSGVLEDKILLWHHALSDCWRLFAARHGTISQNTWTLLGALSQNCEMRVLVSSHLLVCPSIRMRQLGSRLMHFHEILYLKMSRKYKHLHNLTRRTWRPTYIDDNISLNSSWNEKCFLHEM